MAAQLTSRVVKCEVCKNATSKYTCPSCSMKTCSLKCVNQHKKDEECDGLVKTKYIPLNKISDGDFSKDFNLLESIDRCVNSCANDSSKKISRQDTGMPIHLSRLKSAIYQRGSKILFLPQNFKKHQENTTFYDWKEKKLFWRIDFVFLNASVFKYSEERCDENLPLNELIKNILESKSKGVKEVLSAYNNAGIESLDVLMKIEKRSNSDKLFYKLDLNATLKTNFTGKTIIEFPQLFIAIRNFYTGICEDRLKEMSGMKNFLINDDKLMETSTESESSSSGEEEEEDESNNDSENEDSSPLPKYQDVLKSDFQSSIF